MLKKIFILNMLITASSMALSPATEAQFSKLESCAWYFIPFVMLSRPGHPALHIIKAHMIDHVESANFTKESCKAIACRNKQASNWIHWLPCSSCHLGWKIKSHGICPLFWKNKAMM